MDWGEIFKFCKDNKESIKKFLQKSWKIWWVKLSLVLVIVFFVICFLIQLFWKGVVFLEFDRDIKQHGRDYFNEIFTISKCDGFHGVSGSIEIPRALRTEISIKAISRGKAINSSEQCQYFLDIKGLAFTKETDKCQGRQELDFVLEKGKKIYSLDYSQATAYVCRTDIQLTLSLRNSL